MNNVEPNQMRLSFVIANDEPSHVSNEHSICLFSVAKEAAMNEQQIKPCVPFDRRSTSPNMSNVMCPVSHVMCHVSCVMCHVSEKEKKMEKVMKLVGGGSDINRATPSSFLII